MSLIGVHVECGFAGGSGQGELLVATNGRLDWAETLSLPGKTVRSAPYPDRLAGGPMFSLRSSSNVVIGCGRNPWNGSNVIGPTRFVRSGQGIEFFATYGDFVAWEALSLSSGVHICCGFVGSQGFGRQGMSLMCDLMWSQVMTEPGTTASVAPAKSVQRGIPVVSLSTVEDIYYAVGLPERLDISTTPKRFLGAGEDTDIFIESGQALAWTLV